MIGVILLLTSVWGGQDEGVELRWRFEKGKSFEIAQTTSETLTYECGTQKMVSRFTVGSSTQVQVTELDSKGAGILKIRYEWLTFESEDDNYKFSMDTRKSGERHTEVKREGVDEAVRAQMECFNGWIAGLYDNLVTLEFEVVVEGNGQVRSVTMKGDPHKGVPKEEEILERLMKLWTPQALEDGMRRLFLEFPERKVKIGDRWPLSSPVQILRFFKPEGVAEVEVKEIEKTDDGEVVQLYQKGTLNGHVEVEGLKEVEPCINDFRFDPVQSRASIVFNRTLGLVTEYRYSSSCQGEVDVQDVKDPWKFSVQFSTELKMAPTK